ncbi:MAG: DMT family transporter [Deltaproteobacteria bacterium]|nr:DMT family transporter [Deltaproteobacteria bacterium]
MPTASNERPIGPWLVALGAGLWGTESAWRIPLNDRFAAEVIVWWEHVILVALALPFILPRLGELKRVPKSALLWLLFSGFAGSAVGTVFFTLALKYGNPTVVNVVLNIQPVLSTTAAYFIFRDRLARGFFLWAPIAIVAGMVISYAVPTAEHPAVIDQGTGYALVCALFWGLSTVAGRGVMVSMSVPLASGLRLVVGLVCMTVIIVARGQATPEALWPATASADAGGSIAALLALSILSGGIPLLFYFRGLALTRASTAGYFEMMQTLVAVVITWGFFHAPLEVYQVAAGLALIAAVAMVQRAQARVGA